MKKSILACLALILLAGYLLRLWAFCGVWGSDDLHYAKLAWSMANGSFAIAATDGGDISKSRVGLIYPASLLMKITGSCEEWVVVAYPFLLSLAGIVMAFLAGRLFFGERAGLIAAALTAVAPLEVKLASQLGTDIPSAFLANVGILLMYVGAHKESLISKFVFSVLTGTALGLAWLTRESTVYMLPFVAGYLLWVAVRDKRNLALLLGSGATFAAIVAAECLAYRHFTGDPLFRLHSIRAASEAAWTFDTKAFQTAAGSSVWLRLFFTGPRMIVYATTISVAALLAVFYALRSKRKEFAFPGYWFLSLIGIYNFGSTSLTHYSPLLLAERYLYPLLFPAVVLAAGLLAALFCGTAREKRGLTLKRVLQGALVATLLLQFALLGYGIHRSLNSKAERAVSQIIKPSDPLYSDARTPQVLEYFWHFEKATNAHDFTGMRPEDVPAKSYVLINRDKIEYFKRAYGYVPPRFYPTPPATWVNKWHSARADLYQTP